MSIPIKPIPAGAQEAPGYIVDIFDGSAWLTKDLMITDKWSERGVWPTANAAQKAMDEFLRKDKTNDNRTIHTAG